MSPSVEVFIENVRDYCELIAMDRHDIGALRQSLLALMQGVFCLDTNGFTDCNNSDFPHRHNEEYRETVSRLADLPLHYYGVVFYPLDFENESTVLGDVRDDLADIYADLWHGLQAHHVGATSYAINYWRDSYRDHWGRHAVARYPR